MVTFKKITILFFEGFFLNKNICEDYKKVIFLEVQWI